MTAGSPSLPLIQLVEISNRVSALSGRKAKVDVLASLLKRVNGSDLETAIIMLTGSLRQGRIGLGPAAIAEVRATPAAETAHLTLHDVEQTFERIALTKGTGSARIKADALRTLFERTTEVERDYLTRLLYGELRQGALDGLMVDAVARATGVKARDVRRGFMLTGDIATVAHVAMTEGTAGVARFTVQLFRPVQPMLAQPADDVGGAVRQLGLAALEFKLDGARVQIHKAGDEVRVFSRQMNDVTVAVPEIVEIVKALPAREVILDGEAIALKPNGRPYPFQVTMRRFGRKLDVDRMRRELPLTPFLFDALWADGNALLDAPYRERSTWMDGHVPAEYVVPRTVTSDLVAAADFLNRALQAGHEGIMAKGPDGLYEAGNRGKSWLKVKPSHTLDLVVLAAEWGHGRRHGRLSNLHLGARDPHHGGFVMLGKTFKGLTDAVLAWQTEKLLALEIGRDRHTVYVRPELVVEIAFNDVQASPQYPGGLALRFARVKRYRQDKTAGEADTIDTVQAIHRHAVGDRPGSPSTP